MSLTTSIHVRIWKKDIRGAKRHVWDHCPLGRALRAAFPGNSFHVSDDRIWVNDTAIPHTESTSAFTLAWRRGPVDATTVEMAPEFEALLRKD